MELSISPPQAALATTVIASAYGTYIALSPPNPVTKPAPATGDLLRRLHLTSKHTTKVVLAPLGFLAWHTSSLAFLYPNLSSTIVRNGVENGLNTKLITWSAETSIPLFLILCVGIPLRLVSYASLGRNFTFALTEPDRLTTTGIYRHVQHPSYTGLAVLEICNVALLARVDGVLSCWIPPSWYGTLSLWAWRLMPAGLSLVMFGIWTRVKEEERMLRDKFGLEWEQWHKKTARFIPWVV